MTTPPPLHPQHAPEGASGQPEAVQVTARALEAAVARALKEVLEEQRAESARQAAMTAADFYRSPVSALEERAFSALTLNEQINLINEILFRVYLLLSASPYRRDILFINRDPVPYVIYYSRETRPETTGLASERDE